MLIDPLIYYNWCCYWYVWINTMNSYILSFTCVCAKFCVNPLHAFSLCIITGTMCSIIHIRFTDVEMETQRSSGLPVWHHAVGKRWNWGVGLRMCVESSLSTPLFWVVCLSRWGEQDLLKLPGSAARVSCLLDMTVTYYAIFYGHRKCTAVVEINKDHPNENKHRLVIQSWPWRGS